MTSHMTPKLLRGSTVGNPSDSLASCWNFAWFHWFERQQQLYEWWS